MSVKEERRAKERRAKDDKLLLEKASSRAMLRGKGSGLREAELAEKKRVAENF